MEIDQCAVTVRLAQAFEVELLNTAAVFVLGNCLNDLSGVRGHATTELIQGLPNNLTESPHLITPPPLKMTPPTTILFSVFISPSEKKCGGGLFCVCCRNKGLACASPGHSRTLNPPSSTRLIPSLPFSGH